VLHSSDLQRCTVYNDRSCELTVYFWFGT
jgi:hypothetical protein